MYRMTPEKDQPRARRAWTYASILTLLFGVLLLQACAGLPETESLSGETAIGATGQVFEQARRAYDARQYRRAIALLQRAADSGDDRAQYALGYMAFYGIGQAADRAAALRWFRHAAENGNADARIALQRATAPGDGSGEGKHN